MKHLSLLTILMLTSSLVYAQACEGWQTLANGKFSGDCREMMCDCVEKDGKGSCCPQGTSSKNTGGSYPDLCPCKCPENQTWDTTLSKCVECVEDEDCEGELICNPDKICGCPTGTTQYMNYLGVKACCNTTTHTLSAITGTQNKSCCPNETPYWDEATKNCLAACGPNTEFGIVLILDRSGSMSSVYEGELIEERKYNIMDRALAKLKIYPNAYSAVFEHSEGKEPLEWGKNSKEQIQNAIFDYSVGGNTGFNNAFETIEEFCDGNQKFVVLWITDGAINQGTRNLKKLLQERKCESALYMVSINSNDKEKYNADKWINFETFSPSSIEEFNNLADSLKCYSEEEPLKTETIGIPFCEDRNGRKYGYSKGGCRQCTQNAKSCDFKEVVCDAGSCKTRSNTCKLLPENAICDDSYYNGWKCNANFYRISLNCKPCPEGTTSPAGSSSKSSCK